MGCFNVACGISKISIGSNDPVVFLPLRKNSYREEGDSHKAYPFLVHPWDVYVPITLPINGQYNEYGGIDNIVRDKNVEIIEQHFGTTIEEFVDLDKQPELVDSGMFIHKEIYDHFIQRDKEEREFFSQQFDRKRELIVLERELQDAYFKIAFKDSADKEFRMKAMSAWIDVKEERNSFSTTQYPGFSDFYKMYAKAIEEGEIKETFINFKMLELAMTATNSHYSPTMCGYQHGDDEASQELYRTAHQIIDQRLCEYEIDECKIEDEAFFYGYHVTWSPEDRGFKATCDEFPSLSCISSGPENALFGVRKTVSDCIKDMRPHS